MGMLFVITGKRKYFCSKPLAVFSIPLLIIASLLALFPGSFVVFLIAVLIGSAIGLFGVYYIVTKPSKILFSNTLAVSLLLGYALGALIYLSGIIDSFRFVETIRYCQSDLSNALAVVMTACGTLFLAVLLERPIVPLREMHDGFTSNRAKFIILFSLLLVAIAFFKGEFGYMGISVTDKGKISALGALAFTLVPILLPLVVLFLRQSSLQKMERYVFIVFLCLLFLVIIPTGRRVLLYSVLLVAISFFMYRKKKLQLSPKRLLLVVFCLPIICYMVFIGFQYFYAMRVAGRSLPPEAGLVARASGAIDVLQDDYGKFAVEYQSNLVDRPFILSYLAVLIAAQSNKSPLLGEEFWYSLQMAIPSILFPDKTLVLPKSVEDFVHPAFGIRVFDGPNTIITAGYDDFGLIGAVLYPVMLVFIYSFLLKLTTFAPAIVWHFIFFRLLFNLFYVEQSLGGILITGLRDLFLVVFVMMIAWHVYPIFSRRVQRIHDG